MTHYDEMTCLLYLEGQLEPAMARELAMHAESCAECRALLEALEDESRMLSEALGEEDESVPARLLAPVQSGIPAWAWVLGFGLLTGCVYAFWTGVIDPWQQQLSQAGFGSSNLLTAFLFGGTFWTYTKGWNSMLSLIELLALVAFAAPVFLLLRRYWRRWTGYALVLPALFLLLGLASPAGAAEFRHEQNYHLAQGEVVHNDLFLASGNVHIDGTIDGDLIVFCQNLTITGHVTGDVLAFSQIVRIQGVVDHDLRGFVNTLVVSGTIGHSLITFSSSSDLDTKSQVGGGVLMFAGNGNFDGKIARDLTAFVGQGEVNGPIGGDFLVRADRFTGGPGMQVAGSAKLMYEHEPDMAPEAKFATPLQKELVERRKTYRTPSYFLHQALRLLAAAVLGVVLMLALPGFFADSMRATRKPISMGVGALAMVAEIVLFIVGIILICIGVPLGLAVALIYLPAIYASQVFVGTWIGEKLLGQRQETGEKLARLLLGLVVLRILTMIPILGGFVWMVVVLWGVGAILMAVGARRNLEASAA